jgi:DNA-binding NtrC family response regulator
LFGEALKSRGYTVDVFTDSLVASEKIKSEHQNYSLVLTYVRMPKLTGVDLGKQILEVDRSVRIILISAFELMENTDLEYVKKPILISDLIEIVDQKLGSS